MQRKTNTHTHTQTKNQMKLGCILEEEEDGSIISKLLSISSVDGAQHVVYNIKKVMVLLLQGKRGMRSGDKKARSPTFINAERVWEEWRDIRGSYVMKLFSKNSGPPSSWLL